MHGSTQKIALEGGVKCPYCGSDVVIKFGSGKKKFTERYRCKSCGRTFNDLKGTIFEKTRIGLREWIYTSKRLLEGASMNQISQELGRKFDTIMRVRDLATDELAGKLVVELEDEIEVDETYTSAGQKGTKCDERRPRKRGLKLRGRGTYDKDRPPIVSLVSEEEKSC